MMNIVVDKSTDHAKPLLICSFTLILIWNKMILSVHDQDKGIVSHVDTNSSICTLTDNDKLVNQIATLLPIIVKKKISPRIAC